MPANAMSTNDLSSKVDLSATLSIDDRQTIIQALELLPSESFDNLQKIVLDSGNKDHCDLITIKKIVDGRGLACPMPLLKTKVALRDVTIGESVYVLATDPNSQADIIAFCQHSQVNTVLAQDSTPYSLHLVVNQTTTDRASMTADAEVSLIIDTIFHFIITKIGSN